MKKYIIIGLILFVSLILVQTAQALSPSTDQAPCGFSKNVGFGSRNTYSSVYTLQNILRKHNYFNHESTGYFGSLTLKAVKDFQRANGLPPTGFVGVLTRAKINALICIQQPPEPVATSSIQVTAPQGGETWPQGSVQTIQWTDSNIYIQEPKYDIRLQLDLDCKPNQACPMLFPMPFTIAKSVSRTTTGYAWTVGSTTEPTGGVYRQVSNGKYRVYVCPSGSAAADLNGCGKSASYITVTSGTSTVPVTATTSVTTLSPTSGPVGQAVTITGTNFTPTGNTVNFGYGVVLNATSSNGTTITFAVPSALAPACYYSTPQCLIATVITPPGVYNVSVTNTNGTSNSLPFTVVSQ